MATKTGFWQSFGTAIDTFFREIWKFVFDHFTDKAGNYDEKRTTAFALLVLAVMYGVFKSFGEPNVSIFGILMGAGVGQYFSSAYNDGRGPTLPPIGGGMAGGE